MLLLGGLVINPKKNNAVSDKSFRPYAFGGIVFDGTNVTDLTDTTTISDIDIDFPEQGSFIYDDKHIDICKDIWKTNIIS